jgi:hypothetical protein
VSPPAIDSIKGTAAAAAAGVTFVQPALSLCIELPPLHHEGLSLVLCIFQCGYEVLGRILRLGFYQLQIHDVAPCYFVCDTKKIAACAEQNKRLLQGSFKDTAYTICSPLGCKWSCSVSFASLAGEVYAVAGAPRQGFSAVLTLQ